MNHHSCWYTPIHLPIGLYFKLLHYFKKNSVFSKEAKSNSSEPIFLNNSIYIIKCIPEDRNLLVADTSP